MSVRSVLISWDFFFAMVFSIAVAVLLPGRMDLTVAQALYEVGISVLAIVFSVYFAALAIVISSGDDKFVLFLEEDGTFGKILQMFQFTIIVLFIALIVSLALYGLCSVWLKAGCASRGTAVRWMTVVFVFTFSYGLFAALCSALDSIKYARYRLSLIHI